MNQSMVYIVTIVSDHGPCSLGGGGSKSVGTWQHKLIAELCRFVSSILLQNKDVDDDLKQLIDLSASNMLGSVVSRGSPCYGFARF